MVEAEGVTSAARQGARSRPARRRLARTHCGGATAEILTAVEEGLSLDPSRLHLPDAAPIDRALGSAVTVVAAWLTQRAAELDLDPALLATRFDISLLLSGVECRLSHGWRADLVADPINRLVRGEAMLALTEGGRRR